MCSDNDFYIAMILVPLLMIASWWIGLKTDKLMRAREIG
jgi:hypothetical protein